MTSHYVTADLKAGPIIEQHIICINHRYDVKKFDEIGNYIETAVIAQTVEYQVPHKVIVNNGNKTIGFNQQTITRRMAGVYNVSILRVFCV